MTDPTHVSRPLVDLFGQDPLSRNPRVRDGEREPISGYVRLAVLARDGYRCAWCGTGADLQLDHITPWSAGGSDEIDNLRILCAPCNTARSNRLTDSGTRVLPASFGCAACSPERLADHMVEMIPAFCTACSYKGVAPSAWTHPRPADRKAAG